MVTATIIGAVVVSLVFSAVVLGIYRWHPEGFVHEVSRGTESPPKNLRTAVSFALVVTTFFGGTIMTTWWVAADHDLGFTDRFLVAWAVIAIGNLVDLVLLDLVIYTWIHPSFMEVPGYPPMHDHRVHVVGAVKGTTIIGIPAAVLAAAITAAA
ncbi:MAG: hypothetical protein AAGG08_05615 [Actinomycetota bacterium]